MSLVGTRPPTVDEWDAVACAVYNYENYTSTYSCTASLIKFK